MGGSHMSFIVTCFVVDRDESADLSIGETEGEEPKADTESGDEEKTAEDISTLSLVDGSVLEEFILLLGLLRCNLSALHCDGGGGG